MANGDQAPGGGGGQRTYSEEDVMALMNEAAKRAATEAVKNANARKRDEDEDDASISVINPKVVKQLKDTVAVFTALKELSSNPLQKTIEETVGGMAASVVQSAFAPRGPPPKQDIVDKLLNSQFAYGLGSGMGQRAPELVETMGKTFGTDKAGQMMDNIIGKYGSGGGSGGGGQSRQLSPVPSSGSSSGPSSPPSVPEQKEDKQSEKELLLSLDPNNPEHVSAYAETQGGLPVDVARKMLMIHQDAFIEQLKRDGMNVDQVSTQRGSRASAGLPAQQPSSIQQAPPQQASPVQPVQPVSPPPIRQDVPPTYPGSHPGDHIEQQSHQSPDDMEYTEYHDIMGQSPGPQPSTQPDHQPSPPGNVDGQQVEMMKTFATDIGKVMGEMLNKIETLNNTVFTLQSEMNDMKKQGPEQPPPVSTNSKMAVGTSQLAQQTQSVMLPHREKPPKVPPRMAEYPPDMTGTPISPIAHIEAPSLETFEDQVTETPKVELDIEKSGDFFEENVIDMSDFQQELEREAKLSVANSNMLSINNKMLSQSIQQQTPLPELVQPATVPPASATHTVSPTTIQSAPHTVVLPTPPVAQIVKSVPQPPVVQQPIVQPAQPLQSPTIQPVEQPIKEDNITETPKVELDESRSKDIDINNLKEIPIISDDKTSEDKDDNKFVTPIKKTGIHKKAEYRNIKPSFKKNDGEENKE